MTVVKSKIEWTDSTWSPVTGCTKVSPGCDNCYAEGIANRFAGTKAFPNGFAVTLRPERLNEPLKWRKPRRVFVNSMSDLFHQDVPDEFLAKVFAVMIAAPEHTFQVLTKRHGRMRSLLSSNDFWRLVSTELGLLWRSPPPAPLRGVPPWIWLGVSVEDQKRADLRIPALLDTPAAVRFLSCEPLLGPVDLAPWIAARKPVTDPDWDAPDGAVVEGMERVGNSWERRKQLLHWVIVGGESGRNARPMHPDWARTIRDQCVVAGIPYFFKQWGEWAPAHDRDPRYTGRVKGGWVKADGTGWASFTVPMPGAPQWVLGVGKKNAGRELDGRTWDEYPAVADA